jgi:deoxyribonuclease V
MEPRLETCWNLTPREAMQLQESLRERVELEDHFGEIRYVAGADMAFDPSTDVAFGGVIVYHLPGLEEVERRMARRKLRFPYVPGLLSFRECPVLLAAFARLKTEPDLILIDGQGYAHPRRLGIACHIGILFDKPTIGCAKSRLVGEHDEPGLGAGSTAPLTLDGELLGMVLRTRDGVRPIYVSAGHRVSLDSAVGLVKRCMDGFRIPKPTREADHYVGDLRRAYQRSRELKVESLRSRSTAHAPDRLKRYEKTSRLSS